METPSCNVEECASPARARGWCTKHYQRWQKYGDPLTTAWEKGDIVANFWAKVVKAPTGCWLWTGYQDRDGYGHLGVWVGDRQVDTLAHRWSYETFADPIPAGLQLDHLCRVRHCVNPDHLEPVTPGENIRRGNTGRWKHVLKTHCKHGHEFTPENTHIDANGVRRCRACGRDRATRRRATKHRSGPLRGSMRPPRRGP